MKLNELIKQLQSIAEETNASGHKFIENGGEVYVMVDDPSDETDFDISSIEPSIAACGCWSGCIINLSKK